MTINSTSAPLSNPTELEVWPCRVRAYDEKIPRLPLLFEAALEANLTLTLLLLTSFPLAFQSYSEALPTCAVDGFPAKWSPCRSWVR